MTTKKITVSEIRQLISDEYVRGVPEFVFRQATQKYIDDLKKHVKSYILRVKSNDPEERRNAFASAEEVLTELEEKVFDATEDALFQFMQRV